MLCPKCGIYNPYGRQECSQCGHAFVQKPIELSEDQAKATQERRSQPYFYKASPDARHDSPFVASVKSHTSELHKKSKGILEYAAAFAAFLFRELARHKRVLKIILAVAGIIAVILIALCVSCTSKCISEHQRRLAEEAAAAASAADLEEEDPTPHIASMSDVWVLNQYNTKLTLRQDGTFTGDKGTGTWSYDAEKIYFIYDNGTIENHTYVLIGDYLFFDWQTIELTRNCNESTAVPIAGLWINGSGYALALNEDGTHGAGDDEYGKYANAWAYEGGILAMVTIRENVEYFDYYGCQLNGDVMTRLSGTVYVREGGGITLGGGDIEFSAGYDPDA